jgi:hypothetical protein
MSITGGGQVTERVTLRQWTDVVRRARLGRTRKAVALMLATYADADGGRIFPGLPTLAIVCEMDYKTVKGHVDQLVKLGLLDRLPRTRGARGSHQGYHLALPAELLDRVDVLTPTQLANEAERVRDSNRRQPRSTGVDNPRTGSGSTGAADPGTAEPSTGVARPGTGEEVQGSALPANGPSTGVRVPKVQGCAVGSTSHRTDVTTTTPHDTAGLGTDSRGPRARDGHDPGCVRGYVLTPDRSIVRCRCLASDEDAPAPPRFAPADNHVVWVAARRRGITAHQPDQTAGFTGCRRSMRTGELITAATARTYAAEWCATCWPPDAPTVHTEGTAA